MSNIVKWALLVAGAVAIIGMIMALPFASYLNTTELGVAIGNIADICGGAFYNARGLLNLFLLPFGRTVLTGLIAYLFTSWIVKLGIKITVWIYHFIFK